MKSIAIKKFKAEVVEEKSITPDRKSLGIYNNEMELFHINDNQYNIEWTDADGEELFASIGIQTEGKKIIGYDGVFELPKEAIQLLKENGFEIPEEMENKEIIK